MTDRMSAARAHVLLQTEMASYAPGEGFTGAARSDPTQAWPQSISAVIEKYDPVGRRHAVQLGGDAFADDFELTEDVWRGLTRSAVDRIREVVEEISVAQTNQEPGQSRSESLPSTQPTNEPEQPAGGQDDGSASVTSVSEESA